MKKILILPLGGFLAHTTRAIEIGKHLRNSGYDVVYAGPKKYVDLAKNYGFEKHDLIDFNPEYILACVKETTLYFHSIKTLYDFLNWEFEIYDKIKPSAIISDSRFSVKISTKIKNIPLISVTNSQWTKYSGIKRKLPNNHKIVLSLRKFISKDMTEKILDFLMPYLTRLYSAVCLRPYNYHLRRFGIRRLENIEEIWEGDLTLIADIPEFAPIIDKPENFHLIGPIFWKDNKDNEVPNWLNNLNREKPIIYLTMGSSGEKSVFKKIINVLSNTEYQVVISTGEIVKKEEINQFKNIFVEDYLAGNKIIEIADCVIFHGGSGTLYQALSEGTPLIGIANHFEQEWNINRLVELGLGLKLDKESFTEGDLLDAINKILKEKKFKESAEKIKAVINNSNSVENATRVIYEFLQ